MVTAFANDHNTPVPPAGRDLPLRSPAVWFAVAMGGATGVLCRYGWTHVVSSTAWGFPWAVFTENILGAFMLGWLLAVFMRRKSMHRYSRAYFGTGLLGSFTTFSGITADMALYSSAGDWLLLVLYPLISVGLGLPAAWVGLRLGRIVRRERDLGKGGR
jgi:fluoride exporter